MVASGDGRRNGGADAGSLYELSGSGASRKADGESGTVAADGRWWWRNVVALTGSLLLANVVYMILEAGGSSKGYTKLAPWDFVIFPVVDLFFDAPVFMLGAIPLMLAAWYMPYYWSTAKQSAVIAVTALLVPLPHVIVLGSIDSIAAHSNPVWFAVLTVALTVSIQTWAMYADSAGNAVVDVRLRRASNSVEEQLQSAGHA